jgi:tight adherence protein B
VTAAFLYGGALCLTGWLLAKASATARREQFLHRFGITTSALRRSASSRPARWLEAKAEQRGWPADPRSFGLAFVGSTMTGLMVGWHLAGPVGGIAGFFGAPIVLESALSRRRRRVAALAEEQLREAVTIIAAGIRAGLSIRRALGEAARDAESPLREELARLLDRLSVGEPIDLALEELAKRLILPDAWLLVNALAIHRRSGGDLPVLLDQVADIIGARLESRRHVRALTAQGRASGAVLAVLPVAFVALLSGTGGDGLGAFYRTSTGSVLLLGGLVLEGLGFAWIRRLTRAVEDDR